MIKKKTVLILGAGASVTYGFPTGARLKAEICFDVDTNMREYMLACGLTDRITNEFCLNFTRSPQPSIDAWLGKEDNDRFIEIGKFAIARNLLKYEKTTSLFENIVNSYLPLEITHAQSSTPINCWYRQLYEAIDAPFDEFEKNQLSIITFNYDRSLEHFIHTSLQSDNLKRNADEIAKKARSLEIIHVHGQLGYLEWQQSEGTVPYDSGDCRPHAIAAHEHIKIIHEADDSSEEFAKAQQLLNDAKCIYILGLGYHEMNLKRLGLHNLKQASKVLMGTTLNISRQQHRNANSYTQASVIDAKLCEGTIHEFLHKIVILE